MLLRQSAIQAIKIKFSTQKFKAFSTLINTLSSATAVTFAFCGATEKLA